MSEWIDSQSSKPEKYKDVLVSDKSDVFMDLWNGDFWYNDGCAVYVTHWIELPESPK